MCRLILLAAALSIVGAQERLPGRCDVSGLKHLPVNNIALFGDKTWYLKATLGSSWNRGECPTAITQVDPVAPQKVLLTERLFLKNGEKFQFSRPFVKGEKDDFSQNINAFTVEETPKADFYLLAADVDTFSLIYSCFQDTPDTKIVTSEIYTRNKILSPELINKVDAYTEQYEDLANAKWTIHDHNDCPF